MTETLRRRIERLERGPWGGSLRDLPDEVFQQRFDLLLRMGVHALTGRDLEALRGELEALGPLRLPERRSAPLDEATLRALVLEVLRSEPERGDYRELLAMAAGPVSGQTRPPEGT
jgi:hypothetical protein